MDRPPRHVPDYGRTVTHGKPCLAHMETRLRYHCNQACKGCAHCCPLAPETFADVELFERSGRVMDVQEGWDIYSTDGAQLVENLSKPFAACRYCDPAHARRYNWEPSQKDRSEWV